MTAVLPASSRRFRRSLIAAILIGDALLGTWAGASAGFAVQWYVISTADSGVWLGVITAAGILPAIVGAFLAGAASSWIGTRRLVLLSRCVTTIAIGLVAGLLYADALTLPVLAVLIFLVSAAVGPSAAADSARFPEFTRLARIRLGRFNALNTAVMALAGLGALLTTAVIVEQWDSTAALVVASALSALSLTMIVLGFPKDNPAYGRRLRRTTGLTLIGEALQFLANSPLLASILLATATYAAISAAIGGVVIPLIVGRSDATALAFAALMIIGESAAVLGSLIFGRFEERLSVRPTLQGCLLVFAGCALVLAVLPSLGICLLLAVIGGLASGILDPLAETQIQHHSPADLRRATVGIAVGVELSFAPTTALLVGFGESWIGISGILLAIAAILVLVATSLPLVARHGLPLVPDLVEKIAARQRS